MSKDPSGVISGVEVAVGGVVEAVIVVSGPAASGVEVAVKSTGGDDTVGVVDAGFESGVVEAIVVVDTGSFDTVLLLLLSWLVSPEDEAG